MVAEGYKDTEIGVIPVEWDVVNLDDITVKITSGGTPSRSKDEYFTNGTINWIKTGELRDCYIYGAKEKITEEAINNSSAKLFPIDTLLIAMYGATIGQTAYLKTECATNQACCAIIFDKKLANPFFYWKYFYFIKDTLIGLGRGAGQPNISQGIIKDLRIPLPPLKEQEKIAEILSTADDKIDAIQMKINRTETLKKGLLQKLLSEGIGYSEFKDSELGKIPLGWEVVKLSDVCKFKQGIQIPIEEQDTRQNNNQIRFLRISDYTQNTGDIRYVSKDYSNYIVSENDVVMVRYGETAGFIGRGFSGVLANNLFTINPDYRMSKDYLYVYMSQDSIYNYLKSLRAAGAMPAVSFKSLDIIKMPVPSIEEQQTIATISESCDEKLVILHKKLDKYRKLKAGLLQQLLTGKVRVEI